MNRTGNNVKRLLICGALTGALASMAWVGVATSARPVSASPVTPGRSRLAAEEKVDFATQIAPIFKESCVKCHSLDNPRKKAAAGLRLDDKAAAMKGGESGDAIVAGDSKKSLVYTTLLGKVTKDNDEIPQMPKAKKGQKFEPLAKEKIDLIGKWIDQGANWPD